MAFTYGRTNPMTTTANDITKAVRILHPVPVRLSVRTDPGPGAHGRFLLRVPTACRFDLAWLEGFLTRHLGPAVTVTGTRTVVRRDCGRDVEYALRVGQTAR